MPFTAVREIKGEKDREKKQQYAFLLYNKLVARFS